MKKLLILFLGLVLSTGIFAHFTYSEIQTDGIVSDPAGGGGTGDVTQAELDAIVGCPATATQTLNAADSISCTNGTARCVTAPVQGNAAPVDLTSGPQIATTGRVQGDICYVRGTSDTNTVKLDHGTGLVMQNPATKTLGANDIVVFLYNGTDWVLTPDVTATDLGGVASTGHTANGVFFADSSGVFGQDASFNWDSTNNRLCIACDTPAYNLDIRLSSLVSQFHISGTNADSGMYFTGISANAGLWSAGASFNGTNYLAKTTVASHVFQSGGNIFIYGDSGLTAGVTYTPTLKAGAHRLIGWADCTDARTIADNGTGTPAALSLDPVCSNVEITCNDANGCDITMVETNAAAVRAVALSGRYTIINIGTNVINFADTAGVSELVAAFGATQWQTISLRYVADRFVELGRSSN